MRHVALSNGRWFQVRQRYLCRLSAALSSSGKCVKFGSIMIVLLFYTYYVLTAPHSRVIRRCFKPMIEKKQHYCCNRHAQEYCRANTPLCPLKTKKLVFRPCDGQKDACIILEIFVGLIKIYCENGSLFNTCGIFEGTMTLCSASGNWTYRLTCNLAMNSLSC